MLSEKQPFIPQPEYKLKKKSVFQILKDDYFFPVIYKRSYGSLAILFLYLITLYIVLVLFMTAMLIIATQLVYSDDVPYLTGQHSLLKLSPGLGYRPFTNFMTSLIMYQTSDPQTWMHYVINIRTYLHFYEDTALIPQESFASCDTGIKTPDKPDLACKFKPVRLGPCVKQNNFGYDRSQPCIITKINRIYGWIPDIINSTLSIHPLLKCRGQSMQDTDVIGNLAYYPNITVDGETYGYFDQLFFPYLVQVSYRSPLVAVQLLNPKKHVILMLQCDLLNVRNGGEPMSFEILVD